ncbi:hypothetical protein LINGRAHAP2_LOCUS28973 [Linum grandiflorum]
MHLTNPHLNSFSFTYSAFLQPLKVDCSGGISSIASPTCRFTLQSPQLASHRTSKLIPAAQSHCLKICSVVRTQEFDKSLIPLVLLFVNNFF